MTSHAQGHPTEHVYELTVTWTGDRGEGTSSYTSYGRQHSVTALGRPEIRASSDPSFRGDPHAWSPEQLFVASLSQCHMLWYLHVCAEAAVTVVEYVDRPVATMRTRGMRGGEFTEVVLRPRVVVADPEQVAAAIGLHARAHELCYIARSVRCPVRHRQETLSR